MINKDTHKAEDKLSASVDATAADGSNPSNFCNSSNPSNLDPGQRQQASGTIDNDKLRLCRICKQNGFPHEPIKFEKVSGRIRSDGTNEVKQWIVKDYYNGNLHVHAHQKRTVEEEAV